jgi:predicted nicotinamide N-methyase
MPFMTCACASEIEVLVGEIGRPDLPRARFDILARHPVHDLGEGAGVALHSGMVLRLRP